MGRRQQKKMCFSKKLLIADYVILVLLIVALFIPNVDTGSVSVVLCAWIAQIAISSGFYYWKAKSENLIKLPIQLLADLPEDMRERADPNQIIASVLEIGTKS
jgi:hypothetical protein